jgi:hypothetical protein
MALHKNINFYFSLFENTSLIANKPVSDGLYPRFAALFPFYELVDDGEGNMVVASSPTPNATFGDRIRYHFRKPDERIWNTEITNVNIANNVYELNAGVLPSEPERFYVIIPVKAELDESIGDLIAEINRDMRPALETALGQSLEYYQFGVLTEEQVNNFFTRVEDSEE